MFFLKLKFVCDLIISQTIHYIGSHFYYNSLVLETTDIMNGSISNSRYTPLKQNLIFHYTF